MDRGGKKEDNPEENQDPAIKIDIHEIEKNWEKWEKKAEEFEQIVPPPPPPTPITTPSPALGAGLTEAEKQIFNIK